MTLNLLTYRIAVTLTVALGGAAFSDSVRAQYEPRVQQEDLDVTIDGVGNASFVDKVTRTAKDWEEYKESYGGSPSLLKRDLQHQYSSVQLADISLTNDEMNRVSTLSWKGDATTEYIGGGQWEGRLPNGAHANKISETLWEFTTTYPDETGITQETFHIHLPTGATGAEQTQSETGEPVLRYTLPDPPRSPLLLIAALTGILGVVLVVVSLLVKPARAAGAAASHAAPAA